ncbi:hypothetical protein C2G38_2120840 [Gigaspora rosea]|uniref:Uncharacterized protein n=1 Tax=Gigaspora rosea TaxID=44941 RepID=A0A397UB18_9GLOM|nr:hypothetical protein C2G38_2120840 [Gigaspora rosea]
MPKHQKKVLRKIHRLKKRYRWSDVSILYGAVLFSITCMQQNTNSIKTLILYLGSVVYIFIFLNRANYDL